MLARSAERRELACRWWSLLEAEAELAAVAESPDQEEDASEGGAIAVDEDPASTSDPSSSDTDQEVENVPDDPELSEATGEDADGDARTGEE